MEIRSSRRMKLFWRACMVIVVLGFCLLLRQAFHLRLQRVNIPKGSQRGPTTQQQEVVNVQSSLSLYSRICPDPPKGYLVTSYNFTHPWLQLSNITAVIFFNFDHYDAIPLLEMLYGGVFPTRVYCGPVPLKNKALTSEYKINFVTFDNAGLTAGDMAYKCMSNVMLQFPRATGGYLIFPDDILLFPHRLPYLNYDHVWYWPYDKLRRVDISTMKECTDVNCERSSSWVWGHYNAKSFHEFWADFEASIHVRSDLQRYYDNLVGHLGGKRRMASAWADVSYVPARLAKDYITMSSFVSRNHVQLGAAVATMLLAISDDPSNWQIVTGLADWSKERNAPWRHYRGTNIISLMTADYHHPTKWGLLLHGNEDMRKFYCYVALPVVYSRHGRV